MANVQENVILHYKTFYFGNWKYVPKLEISHCNLFVIGPVVFAPRTQTYATELTKIGYRPTPCKARWQSLVNFLKYGKFVIWVSSFAWKCSLPLSQSCVSVPVTYTVIWHGYLPKDFNMTDAIWQEPGVIVTSCTGSLPWEEHDPGEGVILPLMTREPVMVKSLAQGYITDLLGLLTSVVS
jgi:hypothetical protein